MAPTNFVLTGNDCSVQRSFPNGYRMTFAPYIDCEALTTSAAVPRQLVRFVDAPTGEGQLIRGSCHPPGYAVTT